MEKGEIISLKVGGKKKISFKEVEDLVELGILKKAS